MQLRDFKVLSFDCYGTLIDWESGIISALKPLTSALKGRQGKGTSISRDEILQAHARHESSLQRATPSKRYSDLLATVYRRLAEQWGVKVTWDDCLRYGGAVKDWPAFPDSAEALRYLKQHYKLVILSNVDNASFAGSNARLKVDFDAIYTAEDIGSYKPAAANFDYMLAQLAGLGFAKSDVLHVAESMFHDHAPANRQQLASCWVYRRHGSDGFGATMAPADMPSYDFRFNSLGELAAAHRAQAAG